MSDNESGTVALLAGGVVLSIFGISGVLPSRLKFGDKAEVEYLEQQRELGETLEKVVDSVPSGERQELLRYLSKLAQSAPRATSAPLEAIARESEILQLLPLATPDDAAVEIQPRFGRHRVDARIFRPNGQELLVEIKAQSQPLGVQSAYGVVAQMLAWDNEMPYHIRLLLITTSGLSAPARDIIERHEISHVRVSGPQDMDNLAATIRQLLDQLR